MIIGSVRREVGGWGLKGLFLTTLAMLVYRRIRRIDQVMQRLVARYLAGTLRRLPDRFRGPAVVSQDCADAVAGRTRAKPVEALPRAFGWMVWAVGWRASVYGGQLQTLLHEPEMVELLRASPQAVRILRPLCRMLAVDPRYLQPGVVVGYVPAVERVVKKRVRKPRAKVDWGRIPLPRGLLAKAKREGFGKVPRD